MWQTRLEGKSWDALKVNPTLAKILSGIGEAPTDDLSQCVITAVQGSQTAAVIESSSITDDIGVDAKGIDATLSGDNCRRMLAAVFKHYKDGVDKAPRFIFPSSEELQKTPPLALHELGFRHLPLGLDLKTPMTKPLRLTDTQLQGAVWFV